ncbi:PspC domain-containing protein [Microbacterium aquimaris]|uniref:PspC domain-containing protein n=1 Tax=Microbacterium aquimaris TaxID=459816 RepID=UPI002AD290B9|nr:PspC domain-containing protein [Microbacterium aquimaris]MDZ8276525.1 PspC domain-containing protein [Microbacterium aquimaris]
MKKFTRPLKGRWIAGVCLGLANQLGIDVVVFRLIALLTIPVSGWIYILLWIFSDTQPVNARF